MLVRVLVMLVAGLLVTHSCHGWTMIRRGTIGTRWACVTLALQPPRRLSATNLGRVGSTAVKQEAGADKCLVIVESPAKAKTIQKFLGDPRFTVDFCLGHVRDVGKGRDLPKELKARPYGNTGVDVTNDFSPHYINIPSKIEILERLQSVLDDGCSELVLATDEDREGEAISWHLLEVLRLPESLPVKRAVFHEITKKAIEQAFHAPRTIDMDLVRAQETRRIVDRLVGFTVSPLLWKKIAPKLSAGRVQSAGMAMLVQRERERLSHVSIAYFDAKATLAMSSGELDVQLHSVGGRRVATGKDIDQSGQLKSDSNNVILLDERAISDHVDALTNPSTMWEVAAVDSRQQRRKPPKPFTTSTLQQEANKKLRYGASATMRHAQKLYEAGFITYMRTDSTTLSQTALDQAVNQVKRRFGDEFVGGAVVDGEGSTGRTKNAASKARKDDSSSAKFAQEAHEAIRPAVSDESAGFPDPEVVQDALPGQPAKLYQLILQRTLASVMAESLVNLTSVTVQASGAVDAVFRASGSTVVFPGYLVAFQSLGAEDTTTPDDDVLLPTLTPGEQLSMASVRPVQHHTLPPPRFTEASFVRDLEQCGVGRPSTYAQIVETLKARKYVSLESRALVPSASAFAVASLLEKYCPDLVDTTFTARMESELDAIAMGKANPNDYLRSYFLGAGGVVAEPNEAELTVATAADMAAVGLAGVTKVLGHVITGDQGRQVHLPALESASPTVRLLVGPYGAWLEQPTTDGAVIKAALPADVANNLALLDTETVKVLLEIGAAGGGKKLGQDENGRTVLLKASRYGPYLELTGADNETKPKDVLVESKPANTLTLPRELAFGSEKLTLDKALQLLALPREVATHPESELPILVGLDRFGPFLRCGSKYKTLPASVDPLNLTEVRALELAATLDVSKESAEETELEDIEFGLFQDKMLTLKRSGRFGPYLKWGSLNSAVPKALHDDIDSLPADLAWGLMQKKIKKAAATSSTKAKTPTKTKAPTKRSAWYFFSAERRPQLAAEGLSFGDTAKQLSIEWKGLGDNERKRFQQIAEESQPVALKTKATPRAAPKLTKTAAKGRQRGGIKRSPNAFVLFCADHRPTVTSELPGAGLGEITKELAVRWRDIDADGRLYYQQKAKALKASKSQMAPAK